MKTVSPQAEHDFQQLVATVEQLREGISGPAPEGDGMLDASAVRARAATHAWVTSQVTQKEMNNPSDALEQSRQRVKALEGEVARLRRQAEERGQHLAAGSVSGSAGGASHELLLQSLLASTDSDMGSQVPHICTESAPTMAVT